MYNDDRIAEFPALRDAQEKLDAKRKGLRDILAEAGPDYDFTKIKSLSGDTSAKIEEVRKLNDEIDGCKTKVDELMIVARAAAEAKRHEAGSEKGAENGGKSEERKGRRVSLGEAFTKSAAFKEFNSGRGNGPSATLDGIDLKSLFQTGNEGGTPGWDPEDLRTGRVELTPQRQAVQVANYFPQTTTSMSSVVWMEETTFTNAAAETTEGSAYPEAALALTERSLQVRKIAVFLPVTDEQFEDEERSRDYVNNRLPYMIRAYLDAQLLRGDGNSPHLLGTENVSGIQSQALGVDNIPDAVYKAARRIRDDGFAEPNALFIAPSRFETVRLAKTADGQYIWGHPSMPGPFTMWGIPVTETTAGTATKVVLGDYANFSELALRRGLDVQVSNSHADYFAAGKLAIRADIRCAALHYRPKAFAVVTGL